METRKVIDLTEPQNETAEQKENKKAVALQEKEIEFILTLIKSGRTLKEIGESIVQIYKPKRERKPRTPKKYFESDQTTGSEEIKEPEEPKLKPHYVREGVEVEAPPKPEKTPLRMMSESDTRQKPTTPEKMEQLKDSFVLPPDAENIIRILSQRLQNTVDVKIQYLVDEKRIIQVGATAPLYDRTIEKAHDELYVTVLRSLNNILSKTV
jgi:hypothetical protein